MGSSDPENAIEYSSKSRDNGWSLPPHPLQFVAWIAVIIFAVIHNTTLVPALPGSWQPAGYIVPGIALLTHLVCHVVASSINPADPAVLRKKNGGKLTAFDRSKHQHVIENCHCYICSVDVESRSKHCSVCNKCICDFDHHCKWLNNCVGGRNYRWFLATLISGMLGMLLVIVVALVEFIAYFTDRTDRRMLSPYIALNTTLDYSSADFQIMYQSTAHNGWLALLGVIFVLGIIALALLVHLFGFHCYLMYHGISTYDYIVRQREMEHEKEMEEDIGSMASSRHHKRQNKVMPSSLEKRKAMAMDKDPNIPLDKRKASKDHQKSDKQSAIPDMADYQRMLEEAEHRTDGETPPPSASPIRSHEANNNNNNTNKNGDLNATENTTVKKLRKKKKKKVPSADDTMSDISTIDNKKLYQNKGYTLSAVSVPPIRDPVKILPPPMVTPRGNGMAAEYHSDSADSLLEIPTDQSVSMSTKGSLDYTSHPPGDKTIPAFGDSKKNIKKVKLKKKKKEHVLSDDELNATTLFSVNSTAKMRADGSLDYSDGFKQLPLTPTTLRKAGKDLDTTKRKTGKDLAVPPRKEDVPPLDLTALRGSTESVSFAPYTATMRSTDTHNTERLLPVLQEHKVMQTKVADTEV